MSYILEALRKSQEEREMTKVPQAGLEDLPRAADTGGGSRWVVATMLMAAVAVAISLYAALASRLPVISESENVSGHTSSETSLPSGGDHPASAPEQASPPHSALVATRRDLTPAPQRQEVSDGLSVAERAVATPLEGQVSAMPPDVVTQPPAERSSGTGASAGETASGISPATPGDGLAAIAGQVPTPALTKEQPTDRRVESDVQENQALGSFKQPMDPLGWQGGTDRVATEPTDNGAVDDSGRGSFRREAELLRDRLLNLERALSEEQKLPLPKPKSQEVKQAPSRESRETVAKAAPRPGGQATGDRIPSAAELPAYIAQSLPPRNILAHVYNDRPENRFIILNSQRQKQGDTTKDGFVVEDIRPDGVVLRFRDQLFFHPR